MIEAIRPTANAVDILDQRELPDRVEYLHCTRASDVVHAIQTLAVRGAPLIGVAALYGWWLEARALQGHADFLNLVAHVKLDLERARPTAVNLSWALDRAATRVAGLTGSEMVEAIRHEADLLYDEERQRSERMAHFGATLLPLKSQVLTHCNTGSLATIGPGTALGVIREGYRLGMVTHIWVDETRPLLQGARLTAWELLQDDMAMTVITDNMAGILMARGQVDAVIVGADRIAANGDTANKIGTYSLAVLAHFHGVPFYVVAPMSTIDWTMDRGINIPIEERNPDEVRRVGGHLITPASARAYNLAFDVTPSELITAIVTDVGVAYPPYRDTLARLRAREQGSAIGGKINDAGH
jgi:methylthioribose-1-phosphate isomerase